MLLDLVDEIITCFGTAIDEVFNQSSTEISSPTCLEDDEAELLPIMPNQFDYPSDIDYDEVPF